MRPFLVVLLLASGLAGCMSADDADEVPATTDVVAGLTPGSGLDRTLLSEDAHFIGSLNDGHAASSLDGILLHTWWFLPDGEQGPWPAILEVSPYNGQDPCQGTSVAPVCSPPSLATRYVPKGYVVVFADVRGTGTSEGCMDMMGAKEQQDMVDLVEWVAAQPWSDGNVGMQGVSYVGTTPHEALIGNPPHLKAVATVAGVTNQWRNMYQNGVPYQGRFYPLTYEVLEGAPPPLDVTSGPSWALNTADGACDQEEMAEHVRPGVYEKGVYDDYWAERNFTVHAPEVTVPLLYSQGFIDRAVNPMEAIHWFNDVRGPKKAFLHQDGHQYVDRADYFETELAWFDHYLKGIDNGVDRMPVVEVITNTDKIRLDDEWPPSDARVLRLNAAHGTLTAEPVAEGAEDYFAPLALNPLEGNVADGPGSANLRNVLETAGGAPLQLDYHGPELKADLHLAGLPVMHLRASSDQENTYFLCELVDWEGDSATVVQEGWFNAHLREGFDHSAPLTPGTAYDFAFRFEPRDYVFQKGHEVGLRIKGLDGSVLPFDTPAAVNTVHYGPQGSWLELPILDHPVLFERTDETGPAT